MMKNEQEKETWGKSDYDKQLERGQTQGHLTVLGVYVNENHLHSFNRMKVY